MSKKTVVLPGRSHSIPLCVAPFIQALKERKGVRHVGIVGFRDKGKISDFEAGIKYFDRKNSTFKLSVRYQQFEQDLYVGFDPRHASQIATFIINYRP